MPVLWVPVACALTEMRPLAAQNMRGDAHTRFVCNSMITLLTYGGVKFAGRGIKRKLTGARATAVSRGAWLNRKFLRWLKAKTHSTRVRSSYGVSIMGLCGRPMGKSALPHQYIRVWLFVVLLFVLEASILISIVTKGIRSILCCFGQ